MFLLQTRAWFRLFRGPRHWSLSSWAPLTTRGGGSDFCCAAPSSQDSSESPPPRHRMRLWTNYPRHRRHVLPSPEVSTPQNLPNLDSSSFMGELTVGNVYWQECLFVCSEDVAALDVYILRFVTSLYGLDCTQDAVPWIVSLLLHHLADFYVRFHRDRLIDFSKGGVANSHCTLTSL